MVLPPAEGTTRARTSFQRKELDEILQPSRATKQRRTIVQIKGLGKIVPPVLATRRPLNACSCTFEGVFQQPESDNFKSVHGKIVSYLLDRH